MPGYKKVWERSFLIWAFVYSKFYSFLRIISKYSIWKHLWKITILRQENYSNILNKVFHKIYRYFKFIGNLTFTVMKFYLAYIIICMTYCHSYLGFIFKIRFVDLSLFRELCSQIVIFTIYTYLYEKAVE